MRCGTCIIVSNFFLAVFWFVVFICLAYWVRQRDNEVYWSYRLDNPNMTGVCVETRDPAKGLHPLGLCAYYQVEFLNRSLGLDGKLLFLY
jgi:hypothetical protein